MPCVNKISIKSGWLGLYVLKPLYRSRVDREPLAMWFFCLMAAMPKGSCKPARLPHCLSCKPFHYGSRKTLLYGKIFV